MKPFQSIALLLDTDIWEIWYNDRVYWVRFNGISLLGFSPVTHREDMVVGPVTLEHLNSSLFTLVDAMDAFRLRPRRSVLKDADRLYFTTTVCRLRAIGEP